MNYLMHLYLSGCDPEVLVGNLMGDFVKGRLDDRFPPGIRRGIEIHRKIDSFAAGNEFFLRSKRRIDPSFGHFRAVMVDLFYDHFLARYWDVYSAVSLEEFVRDAHRTLLCYETHLPPRLLQVLPRMFSRHWLLAYREVVGIETALRRMSERLRKPGRLAEGGAELAEKGEVFLSDFSLFLPEVSTYTGALIVPAEKWRKMV
ncbi:MAG TPA: ACP phosphodiesterase [Geobacteraceae bacterium]|nr:ACP phosphodiesterase [Geobacteraceae bacterium]